MTEMTVVQLPGQTKEVITSRRRSRFFMLTSVLMLLIVLLGFSPTFYLRNFFPARPIPPYLYLHGLVMTAWYVLFIGQASLIGFNRQDLHRRLGIAGLVLAVAVAVVGLFVNMHLRSRVQASGIAMTPPLEGFLNAIALVGLFLLGGFSLFIAAAIFFRRRAEAHRRLMFLAMLSTLPPAIGPGRWIGRTLLPLLPPWPGFITLVTLAFLIALGIHDIWSRRGIHPITLWGGAFLVCLELIPNELTGNMITIGPP
ncbi:MAG TPA: hypothetical protein VGM97_19540 [Steroidobacteraceae bacterium]|jgi:hypothetical protein